eukprot:5151519-Pleurochrysis_carterae.AAC.1
MAAAAAAVAAAAARASLGLTWLICRRLAGRHKAVPSRAAGYVNDAAMARRLEWPMEIAP